MISRERTLRFVDGLPAIRWHPVALIVDLSLVVLAMLLATWLRFGNSLPASVPSMLLIAIPAFTLICAITFPLVGFYGKLWRYASMRDLIAIVKGVSLASASFVLFMFLVTRLEEFPRSIVAIDWFILIIFLGASRVVMRHSFNGEWTPARARRSAAKRQAIPVLLVGAGAGADLYLRALAHDRYAHHEPVGIIDDDVRHRGLSMRGVRVLGTSCEFRAIVNQLAARGSRPRHVIFTERYDDGRAAMHYLVTEADQLGIATSRLALPTELRRSDVPLADQRVELRPIEITDLLERPQIVLDHEAIDRLIAGRRVLVTGAGGTIGGELVQQIAALQPAELVLIEASEFNLYTIDLVLVENFPSLPRTAYICDIRDRLHLDRIFAEHRPEIVFHAAALKHVPLVELNPCEGVLTNVIGTMNVADTAAHHGALAMVQVSSDKVVNSTSVMGATKRLAELYCQSLELDAETRVQTSTRFMTVRFGNVLGSSGSLIPLFHRQLAKGGPLTVTHPEMRRYFMTVREAVQLILQASGRGLEHGIGRGVIFVLDMGEPIKIVDIARRMIRLAGFTPDVDIQIKITGIRPGEKLFEELFDANEERLAPPIDGILGARPQPQPLADLQAIFEELKWAASEGRAEDVVELVGRILPGYRQKDTGRAETTKAGDNPSPALATVSL